MKILFSKIKLSSLCLALLMVFASSLTNAQDLNEALKLLQSERYEDADVLLKKIIDSNPNAADACFYYGESLLKSYVSDPFSNSLADACKEANEMFSKGLKNDSTNMLNNIGLGMVILLQKNDTAAADLYFNKAEITVPKKAKKYQPKDYTILMKLGLAQLYAKNPRYKKAVAYVTRAKNANLEMAKDPKMENPDIYVTLGDIYVDDNNASEAVKNYNKAVYLNPSLYEPLVKIGRLYMRSRNLQEARNYFDKAKEIDSTYAPLYKGYGEMYAMGGQAKLSKNNFKRFLELSGSNIPAKVQYVNSLFRAKDYKECVANIEDIFSVDKSRNYLNRIAAYSCYEMRPPDYNKAKGYIEEFFKNATPEKIITRDYAYYGRILIRLKDTSVIDKAFEQLKMAYNLDTTDYDLLSDIANNAYYTRRFKIAVEMINKKIAAGKASTADYMSLGRAHYQMAQGEKVDTVFQKEQYQNAANVFTKVTQMEPDNIQAYLWNANTYFSFDPNNAKPKYELVIEKASTDTVKFAKELFDAYSYMSSYYMFAAKPKYDLAEPFCQKMVSLDPKNIKWKITGYTSLGIIATRQKKYPIALNYYKKVMELDPKNEDAQKAIDGINKVLKAQQDQ